MRATGGGLRSADTGVVGSIGSGGCAVIDPRFRSGSRYHAVKEHTRVEYRGRLCERVKRQSTGMDNPFGDGLDAFNILFGRTGCVVEYTVCGGKKMKTGENSNEKISNRI